MQNKPLLYLFAFVLAWLAVPVILSAQNTFATSIDVKLDADNGHEVISLEDGYLIIASLKCFDNTLGCGGLVRTDIGGSVIWNQQFDIYPNSLRFGRQTLEVVKDKIMVAGFTGEGTGRELFLKQLDFSGNELWTQTYPDTVSKGTEVLIKTRDGGFLLSGYRWNNAAMTMSHTFVMKLNGQGKLLWERHYQYGYFYPTPYQMIELEDGRIAIAFTHAISQMSLPHVGAGLLVLDPEGELEWVRTFEPSRHAISLPWVTELYNQTLAFSFNKNFLDDFNYPHYLTREPPVVYGLDLEGNFIWETILESRTYKALSNIITAQNGDIVGVGLDRKFGDYDGTGGWIFRMTETGDTLWQHSFPYYDSPIEQAEFHSLAQTPDGGFIISGLVQDTFPDHDPTYNNPNIWLVKLDSTGCLVDCENPVTLIKWPEPEAAVLQLFPNPANDYIELNLLRPSRGKAMVQLYDLSGRQILSADMPSAAVRLELGSIPKGVYVVKVVTKEADYRAKFVKQ